MIDVETTKAAGEDLKGSRSRLFGSIDRRCHAMCRAWRAPWMDRPDKSSNVGSFSARCLSLRQVPNTIYGRRLSIAVRSRCTETDTGAQAIIALRPHSHNTLERPANTLRRLCEKFLEEGVEWLTGGIRAG